MLQDLFPGTSLWRLRGFCSELPGVMCFLGRLQWMSRSLILYLERRFVSVTCYKQHEWSFFPFDKCIIGKLYLCVNSDDCVTSKNSEYHLIVKACLRELCSYPVFSPEFYRSLLSGDFQFCSYWSLFWHGHALIKDTFWFSLNNLHWAKLVEDSCQRVSRSLL